MRMNEGDVGGAALTNPVIILNLRNTASPHHPIKYELRAYTVQKLYNLFHLIDTFKPILEARYLAKFESGICWSTRH